MKSAIQAVSSPPASEPSPCASSSGARFLGIDLGAETVKLIELFRDGHGLRAGRHEILEHGKKPGPALREALERWDWPQAAGAAITGRFASQVNLRRIPTKAAQVRGYRFLFGDEPATIINLGSHGFSVLEWRADGLATFRENSPCSQGTGNFLTQLVERFSLTVGEASALCAEVQNPAPLSGRCPVILKTDMTHLANKGEERARILAGLFDAVCENVLMLLKPGASRGRVLLTGGLSRSLRVRRVIAAALARQGMDLIPLDEQAALGLEALGTALIAAETPAQLPALDKLLLPPREVKLDHLPALAESLGRVQRMPSRKWAEVNGEFRRLVLGLDIGSTGSKLVAIDAGTQEVVWEGYRQTLGDPVGAAQDLVRKFSAGPAAKYSAVAFGATGSGREIVGSLLTSCYGKAAVFVVNEIVAHATGALHYDSRVDTIFEIGGQDAKYIRLAEGRIIDCAMNEACSAGTGSFIEEQGRKFAGIQDVRQLGRIALTARSGVSLGQHCSVFMAEVIDQAVAAGVEQPAIISGLYDSIIKNYLHRVKGNRSVGKVIFCQGMPFSSDALAAAVGRETGSEVIVPPNPGTVGALGIALLAGRESGVTRLAPLDLARFLEAKVEEKDVFVCRSKSGCGGAGNRCRIERLRTRVSNQPSLFTWGGGCSLHDKGTRKKKLPDLAPDPFRQREELLQKLIAGVAGRRGGQRIALSDEFMLKGLFPFFATFFHEAGFDLEILAGAGQDLLKRGIKTANAPFCAPMQLFHGVAERLAGSGADWLFVPMLRSLPQAEGQRCSIVCPIVQAAPKVLERGLGAGAGAPPRMLSPVIEFAKGNLASEEFLKSCESLARELGLSSRVWRRAWRAGAAAQREFGTACLEIGRAALEFCRAQQITAVVVLGRDYTIYNQVLNSNIPAILREQGAIGIPADCFPLSSDTPLFDDMYWGYGQAILRAAHQVRRAPGVYSLYCSNYSCGPDSFNLRFAAYVMEGKPFAVIETDGHSGDAGTRTRVEAFLHCVEEDQRAKHNGAVVNDFSGIQVGNVGLAALLRHDAGRERLLVPYIGPASESVAAVLRGSGLEAECLPAPDADSLRLGRRHTSGKECLPMPLTLGSLLQRLERAQDGERFAYLMPGSDGPCRFGVYNLLNRIVLERLGWRDRVRIWSPKDSGYFDDLPPGTALLVFMGIVGSDLLNQAKLDVRPLERTPGAAEAIYARYHRQLLERLESAARAKPALGAVLWQVAGGGLFGARELLKRAGAEFAAMREPAELPVVELAGENYVRAVEFSNDSLIKKLEARGLRVHLAPVREWTNYCNYCGYARRQTPGQRLADGFSQFLQQRLESAAFAAIAPHLGWRAEPSTKESLAAASPYLHAALEGEAVLTLGTPLCQWRRGEIDAVVSVGPLECMPTKIAEAQFRVVEREGLLNLTLAFNGEPISESALDAFAFEVQARFKARRTCGGAAVTHPVFARA